MKYIALLLLIAGCKMTDRNGNKCFENDLIWHCNEAGAQCAIDCAKIAAPSNCTSWALEFCISRTCYKNCFKACPIIKIK